MMFTIQEPFYGIILSSMERRVEQRISTMAVARSGNVFKLLYNPAFTDKLPVDTALACLKHEVLHVAFNHFALWDNPYPDKETQFIRNAAADMEVNGYIEENLLRPVGAVFAVDKGWDNFLGTREYFKKIMEEKEQQEQQQEKARQPQKPCNGGQGGQSQQEEQDESESDGQQQSQSKSQGNSDNKQKQGQQGGQQDQEDNQQGAQGQGGGQGTQLGNDEFEQQFESQYPSFDDHSQWPTGTTQEEIDQISQAIDALIDFAAEETEKKCGTIPAEMKGRIEKIRKRPKPVADWKRFFRRYMGNEFTELIRKSKKRESRRFPDAAGNRHKRKSHILVGIDTSGSVSMPEYKEFMGQIKTLTASATFHVIECDARIQHEYEFTGHISEVLHGGGGTDFQPVIDVYNQNKRKYDALVYFTDGYCWIPNDTPKDTLWVISSKGDHDRKKYRVNGARAVFIPKQQ